MSGPSAYLKADDKGEPAPIMRRVICADTTIERLAEILADNPRGVLTERDELSCWFGSFTRYKGRGGGTDLPHWLQLHRAGMILYDRKTGDRRTVHVRRAAVSLCGTVQPGILARALGPEHVEAGLAARLLLAWPPRTRKRWTDLRIDPDTEREYELAVEALLAFDFDRDGDGNLVPRAIALAAEAKADWIAWYDRWADRQAEAGPALAAMLSKIEGYAARLALIHHCVSTINAGTADAAPIGAASIRAGIALAEWFAAEAERVYGLFSPEPDGAEETHDLEELIRGKSGRVTVRELMQARRRYRGRADDAEAALQMLVDAKRGRWLPVPPGPSGGRPCREFELFQER